MLLEVSLKKPHWCRSLHVPVKLPVSGLHMPLLESSMYYMYYTVAFVGLRSITFMKTPPTFGHPELLKLSKQFLWPYTCIPRFVSQVKTTTLPYCYSNRDLVTHKRKVKENENGEERRRNQVFFFFSFLFCGERNNIQKALDTMLRDKRNCEVMPKQRQAPSIYNKICTSSRVTICQAQD